MYDSMGSTNLSSLVNLFSFSNPTLLNAFWERSFSRWILATTFSFGHVKKAWRIPWRIAREPYPFPHWERSPITMTISAPSFRHQAKKTDGAAVMEGDQEEAAVAIELGRKDGEMTVASNSV
jgi:hypothetical protein